MSSAPVHVPVLVEEILDVLALPPSACVIDATVDGGGHAAAMLGRLGPAARLLGLDRDPAVAARARRRFAADARVRIVHSSFRALGAVAAAAGFTGADAILFDLGLSSFHLDQGGRGFSFARDEPLDLRFDPTEEGTESAAAILARRDAGELEELFRRWGEERHSGRIARAIVAARLERPIERSGELHDLVVAALPARERLHAGRSAARIFQALRIAANDELGAVETALPQAIELLRPGGRLAVISFHSLEDRIVKQLFLRAREDERVTVLTRRPLRPGDAEIRANPRAASARLRVAERRREGEVDTEAVARVLRYWIGEDHAACGCEGRRQLWFERSDATDNYIRERFAPLWEKARRGALDHWAATPRSRLALVIVLDQFGRNLHRGAAAAFEGDSRALALALEAIDAGEDSRLRPLERAALGMPLEHAENLAVQERSVAYFARLAAEVEEEVRPVFDEFLHFARLHRDVIARFGRFPHRNEILGRASTPAEEEFLRQPGSSF